MTDAPTHTPILSKAGAIGFPAAVRLLGGIHAAVGDIEQLFDIVAIVRQAGGADAHAQIVSLVLVPEGASDIGIQALNDRIDAGRRLDRGQQHSELVAPQACHRIRFTGRGLEPLGHLAERRIADPMTEGVVELLEAIHIDHQHAGGPPLCAGGP